MGVSWADADLPVTVPPVGTGKPATFIFGWPTFLSSAPMQRNLGIGQVARWRWKRDCPVFGGLHYVFTGPAKLICFISLGNMNSLQVCRDFFGAGKVVIVTQAHRHLLSCLCEV